MDDNCKLKAASPAPAMTEIVDLVQMDAAPLPAPSTSRTPAPRIASSVASTRHSTPTPAPRPRTQAPPPRVTRSRTAAAASVSVLHQRSDVLTARQPLHHVDNTNIKREQSSSLTPPPDITISSGFARTGALDGSESGPEGLDPAQAESSRENGTQDVSRSAAQNVRATQSGTKDTKPPLSTPVESSSLLAPGARKATPIGDDNPMNFPHPRAPSLPSSIPQKRKTQKPEPESEDEDEGRPLLSEYMCPICFSPPKSAVITPCGHILCGACLHGATTARAANTPPLCPVCRTPIPGLRFALPEASIANQPRPGSLGPNSVEARARRSRRRHAPPASRTLGNGISLPTRGEDMVDLDLAADADLSEGETIDVDKEEEERVEDASRSGVIGLELLTMASLY